MAKATILQDAAGWFVEWYWDNDNSSGRGENPKTCRWWGSYEECRTRIQSPPPFSGWVPIDRHSETPPYDAATATGMYDYF